MNDKLGDRIKEFYEKRTRYFLPRRTYTIIRIDGKSFSRYTKDLEYPFDQDFINDMDNTAKFLCENIQGAKFAYVQSDEISILLTDFDKIDTDAWFNGNIQKITSISASLATSKFNQLRTIREFKKNLIENSNFLESIKNIKIAQFDSRVFTIPYDEEVINYFIYRQQDATRNSISSVAQSLYSHKELNGKSTDMMQELIYQKGQNWNNYPSGQKRGRVILKIYVLVDSTKENYDRSKNKKEWIIRYDDLENPVKYQITKNVWSVVDSPIFTKEKEFIKNLITIK